jgi:hypothetical protein
MRRAAVAARAVAGANPYRQCVTCDDWHMRVANDIVESDGCRILSQPNGSSEALKAFSLAHVQRQNLRYRSRDRPHAWQTIVVHTIAGAQELDALDIAPCGRSRVAKPRQNLA